MRADSREVTASSTPIDQPPVFPDSFAAPSMRLEFGLSTYASSAYAYREGGLPILLE